MKPTGKWYISIFHCSFRRLRMSIKCWSANVSTSFQSQLTWPTNYFIRYSTRKCGQRASYSPSNVKHTFATRDLFFYFFFMPLQGTTAKMSGIECVFLMWWLIWLKKTPALAALALTHLAVCSARDSIIEIICQFDAPSPGKRQFRCGRLDDCSTNTKYTFLCIIASVSHISPQHSSDTIKHILALCEYFRLWRDVVDGSNRKKGKASTKNELCHELLLVSGGQLTDSEKRKHLKRPSPLESEAFLYGTVHITLSISSLIWLAFFVCVVRARFCFFQFDCGPFFSILI